MRCDPLAAMLRRPPVTGARSALPRVADIAPRSDPTWRSDDTWLALCAAAVGSIAPLATPLAACRWARRAVASGCDALARRSLGEREPARLAPACRSPCATGGLLQYGSSSAGRLARGLRRWSGSPTSATSEVASSRGRPAGGGAAPGAVGDYRFATVGSARWPSARVKRPGTLGLSGHIGPRFEVSIVATR